MSIHFTVQVCFWLLLFKLTTPATAVVDGAEVAECQV